MLRTPAELGEFHWVVDAKDKNVTDFEDLWTTLMGPFLQTISVRHPTDLIETGDYSYLKRFSVDLATLGPELRATIERDGDQFALDMRRILRDDFVFRPSKDEPCLQAVDILASAVTRALNGSLNEAGWAELGRLFIGRSSEHAVRLVQIRPQPGEAGEMVRERSYHGYVIENIDRRCRSMFP